VSRQDSVLQSLSSDARTESDNLSLTDSSVDGLSTGRPRSSRKQYIRHFRAMKESANLNRDVMVHHTMIPRTLRVSREQTKPLPPSELAEILIVKLASVQREREAQEKLDRHLQDNESLMGDSMDGSPKALAEALREKLSIEDDSDQAILDQHVSRVWSDPTPSRSPGFASPRGGAGGGDHSPERKRTVVQHNYSRSYKQRKEKDVFSTFSADSGNIHDFPEGSDLACGGSVSSLGSHIPKSKSVPSEYAETLHKPDYLQGHDLRFRRSDASKRSATKKSMTELTDSGVSVVSDVPPAIATKEHRMVQTWLHQSDKKLEGKHMRHGKKYGSRSGSLDRTNRDGWGIPAQPFVADPGMPPLPQPNTATQLEEARRRLLEEDRARGGSASSIVGSSVASRQRHLTSGKQQYEPIISQSQLTSASNQSTLRKSRQDIADFTTVVISLCDEQTPYMIKIPGQNITLKQFKDYLPKRGSYRYFFKTECEDLDTMVILEEITDDADVVPLWEGKIMAQVKALE
jgi:axin 1